MTASIKVFGIEVTTAQHVGQCVALADGATDSIVAFYDGLMGTSPTFEAWENARLSWRAGYAEQRPDVKAGSIDKAWWRFASGLSTEKPKAENAKAQAVAAARVNPYEGKTESEIAESRKAIGQKIAAGDVSKEIATQYRQAVDAEIKARKATEKAAAKATDDVLKTRRDALKALVIKADAEILAILEAAADITSTDGTVRAKAWAILTAAAKPAQSAKGKTK